jgi:hypothetical protein
VLPFETRVPLNRYAFWFHYLIGNTLLNVEETYFGTKLWFSLITCNMCFIKWPFYYCSKNIYLVSSLNIHSVTLHDVTRISKHIFRDGAVNTAWKEHYGIVQRAIWLKFRTSYLFSWYECLRIVARCVFLFNVHFVTCI